MVRTPTLDLTYLTEACHQLNNVRTEGTSLVALAALPPRRCQICHPRHPVSNTRGTDECVHCVL